MECKPGTVIRSVQELIGILQSIQKEYGNDVSLRIIDPIDQENCGPVKFIGIGKDGTLYLEYLLMVEI